MYKNIKIESLCFVVFIALLSFVEPARTTIAYPPGKRSAAAAAVDEKRRERVNANHT